MRLLLFFFLAVFASQISKAQDSTSMSLRRNTIKLNLTGNIIYTNHLSFSFERVVKQNQSFVLTAGYQEFRKVNILGENIVRRDGNRGGYKVGGEYRFYLKKENKFSAPRGVYIGPFITAHKFNSDEKVVVTEDGIPIEANLNSRIKIFNLGAQLGYQFVFNDRWTVDLILIGPAFSKYNFKTQLQGDFDFDPEDIQNEILKELINKYPLLEDLLNQEKVESSGNLDTWAPGYKYQVLLGYRFGKYKNLKKK